MRILHSFYSNKDLLILEIEISYLYNYFEHKLISINIFKSKLLYINYNYL